MVDKGLGATSGILLVVHVLDLHRTIRVNQIIARFDGLAPTRSVLGIELGSSTYRRIVLEAKWLLIQHTVFLRFTAIQSVVNLHALNRMVHADHQAVEEGV